MLTWSVLVTCLVLVTARPQRIRFPDQPSSRESIDDGAIFVRGGPARSNLGRALNPLVNTIPREPLTLADPDQFLNAWQFYYPPGPPPASQEDFDAEGSDLPATLTVSDSAQNGAVFDQQGPPQVQIPVQPIIQIPVQPVEQFQIQPEVIQRVPTPVIISPAISGVQLQPEQSNKQQPETEEHKEKQSNIEQTVNEQPNSQENDKEPVKASSQTEQSNAEQAEKTESETENAKKEVKSEEKLVEPISDTADQQASTSNVTAEKTTRAESTHNVAKPPPDFKPRFEAGGWTPLEGVPGLL